MGDERTAHLSGSEDDVESRFVHHGNRPPGTANRFAMRASVRKRVTGNLERRGTASHLRHRRGPDSV